MQGAIGAAIDRASGHSTRHGAAVASNAVERANDHLSEGSTGQALTTISQASALFPAAEQVVRTHLQIARALGDINEWRIALNRLDELVPEDASIHFQRSVFANQGGEPFTYRRSLNKADDLFHKRALDGDVSGLAGLLRTRRRAGDQSSVESLIRVAVAETHRRPGATLIDEAATTLIATGDTMGRQP